MPGKLVFTAKSGSATSAVVRILNDGDVPLDLKSVGLVAPSSVFTIEPSRARTTGLLAPGASRDIVVLASAPPDPPPS